LFEEIDPKCYTFLESLLREEEEGGNSPVDV
jgi:hypothetical protein